MPWEQEDIKDVMKLAVGTMIGGALIALASQIYDVLTPLVFALILFIAAAIIIVIIWVTGRKDGRTTPSSEPVPGRLETPASQYANPPSSPGQTSADTKPIMSEELMKAQLEKEEMESRMKMEYKLRKKELKAQKKTNKKVEKEKD